VNAQVIVKGNLEFTHPNDSLRNFQDVSSPDSLNQVVRTTDYIYQRYFDNEITINDSAFHITTTFEYPAYTSGMNIVLNIPPLTDSINTPSYLKINQYPPAIIVKINGDTVTNIDLTSNNILYLVYDGNRFMIIANVLNKCKTGYKNMKNEYCIQKGRNPAANFFNANKTCIQQGYHLCSLQEWYYACVNNSGMANLPLNFEWVHSSGNHNTGALKIGSTNCTNSGSDTAETYLYYYRCCYHLK
jgi:hypothetical protein